MKKTPFFLSAVPCNAGGRGGKSDPLSRISRPWFARAGPTCRRSVPDTGGMGSRRRPAGVAHPCSKGWGKEPSQLDSFPFLSLGRPTFVSPKYLQSWHGAPSPAGPRGSGGQTLSLGRSVREHQAPAAHSRRPEGSAPRGHALQRRGRPAAVEARASAAQVTGRVRVHTRVREAAWPRLALCAVCADCAV